MVYVFYDDIIFLNYASRIINFCSILLYVSHPVIWQFIRVYPVFWIYKLNFFRIYFLYSNKLYAFFNSYLFFTVPFVICFILKIPFVIKILFSSRGNHCHRQCVQGSFWRVARSFMDTTSDPVLNQDIAIAPFWELKIAQFIVNMDLWIFSFYFLHLFETFILRKYFFFFFCTADLLD